MNNKGFSLIELLGCLALLAVIFCIGLYNSKGTLATTFSILNEVSVNELYDAAELYVVENPTTWIHDTEEYVCLAVSNLVDGGYFEESEVQAYKDKKIKVVRDAKTKVVNDLELLDLCE